MHFALYFSRLSVVRILIDKQIYMIILFLLAYHLKMRLNSLIFRVITVRKEVF